MTTDIRQALAADLQRMGLWPEVDDETEPREGNRMTTIDPKTGKTHLDPDDPRDQADREAAREYRERQIEEFGEVHAPYAYPAVDPETGEPVWYGG